MDERFLEAARGHDEAIARLLVDIIERPSLSRQEKDVVQRIGEEMTSLGFDDVIVDPLGSVIGRVGDGPVRIVFDCHVDVVDVGALEDWKGRPFEARVENGAVFGRGASDNKAAIAAMVHGAGMLRELGEDDGRFTLYVVGTVQKEVCEGLALEHILTEVLPIPEVVVMGEATNLQLYRGQRGRAEFVLHTRGRAALASAPERGVNAIYKVAPILEQIEALNDRLPVDPFLGKGTVVASNIEVQTPSLTSVPDGCTVYLDRRLTTGETVDAARAELKSLPAVRDGDADVELVTYTGQAYTGKVMTREKHFPAWVLPATDPAVRAGVETAELALGTKPAIGRWVSSTDGVASAGKLGIPTIGFGPANEMHAHSPDDQCPMDHLAPATAWYAAFPGRYLSVAGHG